MRRQDLQDKDAEPDTSSACTAHDRHQIHDQDSSPETCLRAIHDQESPRFESVAQEEDDGEEIDEETGGDQQQEDDYSSANRQYTVSAAVQYGLLPNGGL